MFYRLPPKFTTDLPVLNLVLLSFAPIFAIAINFWMLGNKQLFGFDVDEKPRIDSIVQSHHTLGETLQRLNDNDLSYIEQVFLVAFLLFALIHSLSLLIYYCGQNDSSSDKQRIPSYIASLKNYDVDELLEEERVYREQFYTYNMELKVIKKIEQSKEDGAAKPYEVPSI